MVSIFADEVFNETVNIDVTDQTFLLTEIPPQFSSLPVNDLSSVIGGFTYVEEAIMEFNFVGGLDVNNTSFGRTFNINAKPLAIFEGNLNLLEPVQYDLIGSTVRDDQGEFATIENFQNTVAVDSYIDTPIEIGYDLLFSGSTDGFQPRADGTQNLDVELKMRLIGRKP